MTGTVNVTPKDHVVYLPSKPGSCLPSKPGSSCIEGPAVSKSGARVQVKMSRRCYLCLQAHSRWRHHSRQSRTTVNGPLTGPPWWRGSRTKSWRRLKPSRTVSGLRATAGAERQYILEHILGRLGQYILEYILERLGRSSVSGKPFLQPAPVCWALFKNEKELSPV